MTVLLRRFPATLSYLLLLSLGGLLIGLGGRYAVVIHETVSTGYEEVLRDGRWWTPVASVFFPQNPALLFFLLPLAAVCLGLAEHRMGTRRTVLATIAGVIVGVMGGLAVQAVGVLGAEMWSRNVQQFEVLDPTVLIAAALLASTAFVGGIWQARIRVVALTTCAVFLLYSGQPSDLYRLIAAVAGLAIGRLMFHRPAPRRWLRSPHHELRFLAAMVVAITAIGPVITLFSGRRYGLLAPLGLLMSGATPSGQPSSTECAALAVTRQCLRDLSLQRLDSAGPVILTVLPLITLLVAAFGLSRGRRLAAWLTIIANLALAGLGIFYYGFLPLLGTPAIVVPANPHYWEITLSLSASVLVPLLIAAFIARNLRHFRVRGHAGSAATYVRAVALAFVALSGIYLIGGWVVRDQFTTPVTLAGLLADLPERFIPISFLRHEIIDFAPNSFLTHLLYDWVGPAFWIVVLVGALGTYFDAGARNYAEGLPRVRDLIHRGGGGDLGQWATWTGNSYWFSEDGRASVAYRVLAGVAITTTEPIGAPDAAADAITGFARFCDDRGWIPVFYAIHESFVPSVLSMGWRTMVIGEETVIPLANWSLTGKRWQDIRSSINRAKRLGVTATWTTFAEMSASWQEQIEAISNQWVAGKALPEMGFTLGSIEELRAPDTGIMVASDADDRIIGVTSWMPSYRDGAIVGWTLDFMRRTPGGMNGVMEFLIAMAAERFREQGAELMSLSTAPFAGTLPEPGSAVSLTDRFLTRIGTMIEPVYGFRSLFDFKKKFQPELHSIYLAYPDALALPAIGVALVKAYLPKLSVRHAISFLTVRTRRTGRRAAKRSDDSEASPAKDVLALAAPPRS